MLAGAAPDMTGVPGCSRATERLIFGYGYERLFRASSDHDRFGALSRHSNANVRFQRLLSASTRRADPTQAGRLQPLLTLTGPRV